MSIISLIIKREYLSRVRKKSFIVMTILGPILMAALMVVPVIIAAYDKNELQRIQVIDESKLFSGKLSNNESMEFTFDSIAIQSAKEQFDGQKFDALLYIPANVLTSTNAVMLFSMEQPNLPLVTSIEKSLQQEIENMKLQARGIDRATLAEIKTDVSVNTRKLTEQGEETSSAGLSTAVGMIGGILIYMFIFLYGAQVMRGVIEEKTNRIVEVIISSVKPFQLMMGKIVGIALVGLTQFILWIVLTLIISTTVSSLFLDEKLMQEQMMHSRTPMGTMAEQQAAENFGGGELTELMASIDSVNFPLLIGAFLFFFIGGYLLYGSLFAAIGAAVDNEADTQQFMLPITIPLILSFVVAQTIIQNPDSPMGFWFSVIPFTSPVVMMVRLPFGVPMWEMGLSMALLVIGFIATTWLAGRIYRTGILMYGKKPSWKELGKWLFYKE